MNIFLRLLRTTWQNIYRHGLTSLVAVSVTTLLFLLFNALLFAGYFQESALKVVNERLDLALNFEKAVDEFQVNSLTEELKATFPEIRNIKFVSSEEAFGRFIQNFGKTNQKLAKWLQANTGESPLPATLIISADAQYHGEILKFIAASRFANLLSIQSSQTGELASEAAEKIITFDTTISNITLIATAVFGLLAILIIMAIVRLTILSRYTEVTIMRLVGATRQFVQMPFIFEGVIFGVTASLISTFIFLFLITRFDTAILAGSIYGGFGELLKIATASYLGEFILLLGWQALAAALIGVVASLVATRKYLRRDLVF
jgi:cell division transport system permease protein